MLVLLFLLILPLYSMQQKADHHVPYNPLGNASIAWMDEEINKSANSSRTSSSKKEEAPMTEGRKKLISSNPLPCVHAEETNAKAKDEDLLRILRVLAESSQPNLANDTSDLSNILFQVED